MHLSKVWLDPGFNAYKPTDNNATILRKSMFLKILSVGSTIERWKLLDLSFGQNNF